ncbi:MAG TPA: penicillin-binding protein activator LpoB [bacterium]|nr:penicillin-binding protein activator LpoB [bacterium]
MKTLLVAAMCLALALTVSCQRKVVTRIDTEETVDLSGRWNDTDSRMVSEAIVKDCLNHPWLSEHAQKTSKRPVVIVGIVRNESTEHIPVMPFISDIERACINSGQVDVVAAATERGDIRDEREDQQKYADEETVKKFGRELGADYMLNGYISSITDQEKGKKVIYYQVDLTLTNIETNQKVWIGQEKIKKLVERKSFGS